MPTALDPATLDAWFSREILVHEEALVRYLRRRWQNPDDVLDLRQETYARVYESARHARPASPKSYLFTAARNLMADRIRRGRVVSIECRGDMESLNVMMDEISPEVQASARDDLRQLARAFDRLPPRCREVVWMRRVEELSQRQVAERLGISEKMVEKHIANGMRYLADQLFGGATATRHAGNRQGIEQESPHGTQRTD